MIAFASDIEREKRALDELKELIEKVNQIVMNLDLDGITFYTTNDGYKSIRLHHPSWMECHFTNTANEWENTAYDCEHETVSV